MIKDLPKSLIESARQVLLKENTEQYDYRGEHQAPDVKSGIPITDVTGTSSDGDLGGYPEDFYSSKGAHYYGDGRNDDHAVHSQLVSLRNRPNASVKIYRAVPYEKTHEEKINELEQHKAYILKTGNLPPKVTTGLSANAYFNKIHGDIENMKANPPKEEKKTKIKINPGDWVTTNRAYAKDHGEGALNGNYKIISKTVPAKHLFTDANSIHELGYDPRNLNESVDNWNEDILGD